MGQEVFKDAPEERFKWFAIDADGTGYFYLLEPIIYSDFSWDGFGARATGIFDLTGIDWKTTLIERQNPAQ
jgi:hypothetical protein